MQFKIRITHFVIRQYIRRIAATFCSLIFFFQMANAQTVEFVPLGISLTSIEISNTSYDRILTSNSSSASVLEVYRDRNHINDKAVTGSITHEVTALRLSFQYGLFKSINLGFSIPYLDNQRKSSIRLVDSGQSDFYQSVDNAGSTGTGDLEVYGIWRLFYTDEADLQLGMALNGDRAPYNHDNLDKEPLGSGSQELSVFLRWYNYSIDSSLLLAFEAEHTWTGDSTVKIADGLEAEKSQENSMHLKLDLSANSGGIGYGAGWKMQIVGSNKLDGDSQKDGYLAYTLNGFLTLGNLHILENQVIRNPWEVKILAEKNMIGNNAPDAQTLSVKLTTFF